MLSSDNLHSINSKKEFSFPSKSQVKKAGDSFRKGTNTNKEENLNTIFLYRRQHNFILEEAKKYFEEVAKSLDNKIIVTARLKKLPTIIEKLKHNKTMSLSNMNDIAGCRIITENIKILEKTVNALDKDCKDFKFKKKKNYLLEAKADGYRGVHLIYIYKGEKKDYQNLQLELQVRTKIQNNWATAVEIVDTFENENLKRGFNNSEWGSFFKLVSYLFEKLELRQEIINEDREKLRAKKHLIEKLKVYKLIDEELLEESKYYVLKLNIKKNKLKSSPFSNLEEANDLYEDLEKESKDNIVLISLKSLKDLREAYKNYFIDLGAFLKNLKNIYKV